MRSKTFIFTCLRIIEMPVWFITDWSGWVFHSPQCLLQSQALVWVSTSKLHLSWADALWIFHETSLCIRLRSLAWDKTWSSWWLTLNHNSDLYHLQLETRSGQVDGLLYTTTQTYTISSLRQEVVKLMVYFIPQDLKCLQLASVVQLSSNHSFYWQ